MVSLEHKRAFAEAKATVAVFAAVRSGVPAQRTYEKLLTEQLWRVGPIAAQEALQELADPANVALARQEYAHIWSALAATLQILGPGELRDGDLQKLWRPATPEQLRTVRALIEEVRQWLQSLPPDAFNALRGERTTVKGQRRTFRQAAHVGTVLEADRLSWYHEIKDSDLARQVHRHLPRNRGRALASVEWLDRTIRKTFWRADDAPARLNKESREKWRRSVLGRWFAPLRPNVFAERRKPVKAVDALSRAPSGRTRRLTASSHDAALRRYLPDAVWSQIEPLLPSPPEARSKQRSAILGIAFYAANDLGWKNLPHWVGVSYSTSRRLLTTLVAARVWPAVLRQLTAGPYGHELDCRKLP